MTLTSLACPWYCKYVCKFSIVYMLVQNTRVDWCSLMSLLLNDVHHIRILNAQYLELISHCYDVITTFCCWICKLIFGSKSPSCCLQVKSICVLNPLFTLPNWVTSQKTSPKIPDLEWSTTSDWKILNIMVWKKKNMNNHNNNMLIFKKISKVRLNFYSPAAKPPLRICPRTCPLRSRIACA